MFIPSVYAILVSNTYAEQRLKKTDAGRVPIDPIIGDGMDGDSLDVEVCPADDKHVERAVIKCDPRQRSSLNVELHHPINAVIISVSVNRGVQPNTYFGPSNWAVHQA
jgi:hypothetical protein